MSTGPAPATRGPVAERVLLRTAAVVVLLLGTLPIAAWIPGGLSDAGYARRWMEWGYGTLICAGAAIVGALVWGRRVERETAPKHSALRAWMVSHPTWTDATVALCCFAAYLAIAWLVFDARPLLIDEIVQVLQARTYASGQLSTPTDSAPEFFSVLHMVDTGPRMYSQFPPGWAAMLVLGTLVRAEWLIGPMAGAVAVFVFARLIRRLHGAETPWFVVTGALMFGLAPFVAFQFGSHMSHGPFVMWMLAAVLLLAPLFEGSAESTGPAIGRFLFGGISAGMAFAVRPLDGIAFVAPLFALLAWRALRRNAPVGGVLAAAAGSVLPLAVVMFVNVRTTGSATTFGYEALWGASHGLGFHESPWGDAHTPQRGLELVSLYVTRLNAYLFESPFPSLLPVVVALAVSGPLSAIERLLLVVAAVHGGLYFAYWHDGFYLGPRFVLPWVPGLLLVVVRVARRIREPGLSRSVRAGVVGAVVSAIALTAFVALPVRVSQYRSGLASMRTDYGAAALRAGVSNALVFVRESWGAQLIARLWALGVSRPATATLYSRVDACVLEHAVSALERRNIKGSSAEAALQPLLRDSALVRASNVSPDTTERMLPGATYDSTCTARVSADRDGYVLYPPLLLDRESGNVYARDFQERDTILTKRFADRPHFLLSRNGVDGTAPLTWTRLSSGRQP